MKPAICTLFQRYYLPLPKHPTPSIKDRTQKTLKTLFLHIYALSPLFYYRLALFTQVSPPWEYLACSDSSVPFFYSTIPSCIFAYRYPPVPPCTPLPHQNPSITEITSFEKSAAEDFFIILLLSVSESSLFRDFFVK